MKVRRAAFETLGAVLDDGAYANLALKEAAARVPTGEVSFLYALVYTALENRSYVEYLLSHYCKRQKRVIRTVLLLSASELLFLHTPAHAAINEAVALAKELGKGASAGLVNAVLRRLNEERDALPSLPTDPILRLTVRYGYPEWVAREWAEAYGIENAERLMQTRPSKTQVRAQYPVSTDALQSALPVPATRGTLDPNCLYLEKGFSVEDSELYRSGALAVQNEGAMRICRALGDVQKKKVLDACAAPGGKTAYLASLTENDVDLFAWELHPHRKELLDATLARLHVRAETACRDASVRYADCENAFDAVLLDVPCSGLGLLGDKPDLRYRKTEADRDAIVEVQKAILHACCGYVKPGGILVYATCTISREENERQVEAFLRARPDYTLVLERQYLPYRDGIDGFYHATMRRG